jgi:histidinol-phosphatase
MTNRALPMERELEFALAIADRAGDVALKYFRLGVAAQMKNDNTPVTIADKECERLIRSAIAESFPEDAILGEEEGTSSGAATARRRRKWIIDPIDGTYNYARQIPIWALLLALEEDGEIQLGLVHAPAMQETFWARRGGGAFRNGEPVHVSTIKDVGMSLFAFGGPNRIMGSKLAKGFQRVIASTYRQRGFGDYLNFAYVFSGKAEAALETGVNPWDLAPMKIIVEEAGGRYCDLEGGSSIYKGSCLVSNGLVHDEILRLLID